MRVTGRRLADEVRPRVSPWWPLQRAITRRWIEAGLAGAPAGWAAKTDLFDEASGPHHPLQDLPPGLKRLGIDLDPTIVASALPALGEPPGAAAVAADVRCLPFQTASLSAILSLSTLDHLDSAQEIQQALDELARCLRPQGRLLLTLDNPRNPEVWLRQALPGRLVRRLRADTFPLGSTLHLEVGSHRLEAAGLTVEHAGYLGHAPRYPLIRLLDWLQAHGRLAMIRRLEPMILGLEGRGTGGLRRWTGHFCVWIARREPGPG